jgi:hypothetical protein
MGEKKGDKRQGQGKWAEDRRKGAKKGRKVREDCEWERESGKDIQ